MSDGAGSSDRWSERLKSRLAYLQPAGGAGSRPGAEPGPVLSSGGWERCGESTFVRRVRRPLPDAFGSPPSFSRHLVPPGLEPERIMVFDTETTGLSGGAGSAIFLLGTGWPESGEVCYEQLFLADFPGEPDFLARTADRLGGAGLLVSYNGRSFDSHLLKTRFAMNRRECALPAQLDLLYWARRLWKRSLGDCSLANIERQILNVRREHDIPGYEIPGVYLEYLRRGGEERLEAVFEHNLQDLDSLFRLLFLTNAILISEQGPVQADQAALGSYLLERMDDRGVARLERSFREGDPRAGRSLSLYYKRRRRWREAVEIWEIMAAQGQSLFAALELAKYDEHRRRRPGDALARVERILAWSLPLGREQRRELEARKQRLQRKLEKILRNGSS